MTQFGSGGQWKRLRGPAIFAPSFIADSGTQWIHCATATSLKNNGCPERRNGGSGDLRVVLVGAPCLADRPHRLQGCLDGPSSAETRLSRLRPRSPTVER